MIADPQVKAHITREWAAMRTLCASSHRSYAVPGVFINETPPESFYNLPFVLAYAILDEVLGELMVQRVFSCKDRTPMLGAKMTASQTKIPWQNYALVEQGRVARNELAHEAKLLPKADCFRFIEAIETELRAWSVI